MRRLPRGARARPARDRARARSEHARPGHARLPLPKPIQPKPVQPRPVEAKWALPKILRHPLAVVDILVVATIVVAIVGIVFFAPTAARPTAPTDLDINVRDSVATVSWKGAGSEFVVQVDDVPADGTAETLTVDEPFAVLGQLDAGVYAVRVTAVANGLRSDSSKQVTFTMPEREYPDPAPQIDARASSDAVFVEWEEVAVGVRYRAQLASSESMDDATDAVADEPKQQFTGVKAGEKYHVRVRAEDKEGTALSAWSAVKSVTVPKAAPLRVASYNIRCAGCKGTSWATRRPAVVATIKGQRPDVIGLQEALQAHNQFDQAVSSLGAPYRGLAPGSPKAQIGIVYNSETLKLIDSGNTPLPMEKTDRRIMWAVLEQKSTGKVFLFGSTHLDNGKGAAKNALRVKEAKVVISVLKSVSARHGDCPTILTGDINSYPGLSGGNGAYTTLVKAFLDPLGRASDPGVAKPEKAIDVQYSSWNDFKRKARKSRTYLDFIFVTPMRVTEWQTVVNVDSSGDFVGTIPSDHNMVRATVELP